MNRSRWLRCGSSPRARVQTTTSRATSAGRGVWISRRPGRVEIRGRHLADEGALVADQRRDEVELAREPQRARDHPTGDQAHQDPAPAGRADRPARVGPDHQVVADERPVDVESDQADGQDGFGRHDAGHRTMMPDGRSRRWRRGLRPPAGLPPDPQLSPRVTRATRGRPARSVSTVQVQPGRRSATQSTMACPWSAPISSRATPPPASATGNRSTSRPMTASPSGPPSRARLGSKVVARGSVGHRVVADVGQVGQHEVEALAGRPVRQQVGDREGDPVGDRVADGVLAREIERIRGDVDGEDLDRLERPELAEPDGQRDRDRAAPRPDVDDPERRGGRLDRGSGRPACAWSRPARARPGAPSRAAGSALADPPRTRARRTP